MKDIKLPLAVDTDGKSSVTLLFAYIAFIIACMANAYLLYKDVTAGTVSSLTLFFGSMIFYRLRKLDKVKFDLDDKSFELEGSDDVQESSKENK